MPCVWLNWEHDGSVRLVYTQKMEKSLLKMIVYVVHTPADNPAQVKVSIDLTTGAVMPCVGGQAVHVSRRVDKGGQLAMVRPHPTMGDFLLMLTNEGQYNGIYHKEKRPVVAALHWEGGK